MGLLYKTARASPRSKILFSSTTVVMLNKSLRITTKQHRSSFLEAPLVQQGDSELKNPLFVCYRGFTVSRWSPIKGVRPSLPMALCTAGRIPQAKLPTLNTQCGRWHTLKWSIADLLTSSHPQMSASHLLGLQGPQPKLWNQVPSLDHFVIQNSWDFLCWKYS